MKRVVLITVHHWNSKKRAGFHWLADSFHKKGYEVLFFTCPLSLLSVIANDERVKSGLLQKRNQVIKEDKGFWSFVWFTAWHPANLCISVLNSISSLLFKRYGGLSLGESEDFLKTADIIVFESGAALMLFPKIRAINPRAVFVYRVSDDLRLLKSHPVIVKAEADYAEHFNLVSVPNSKMLKIFEDTDSNIRLHLHGINKQLFDQNYDDPYQDKTGTNAVFVGISMLDTDFVERASRLMPDWTFHIIGPLEGVPNRDNIIAYGELKFNETIPFIKHADIGLATRSYAPGAESLGDSLKIIQYTYCKLPIIAPDFIDINRDHAFYYKPGDDESILKALENAKEFDRTNVKRSDVLSWDELAAKLEGDADAQAIGA
jgi:2-beta-glucuronyltransferase